MKNNKIIDWNDEIEQNYKRNVKIAKRRDRHGEEEKKKKEDHRRKQRNLV